MSGEAGNASNQIREGGGYESISIAEFLEYKVLGS